jgi:type IV pilus assembly protein PilY1
MSSPNAKNLGANKWYLVFGSGPADAAGRADRSKLMRERSDQTGKLFVLDLNALVMEQKVKTAEHSVERGAFISDPVRVDLDVGAKNGEGELGTDLVYFGTVAGDSASPAGKIYRLRTHSGAPENWEISSLMDVGEPVSAAPSIAVDEKGSLWIYFGTGRLFHHDDIPQTRPMSFYGIKEPETDGVRNWETVAAAHLFDSASIYVSTGTCGESEYTQGCVGITQSVEGTNATRDWAWLSRNVDAAPGWKHTFANIQERALTPPAILGGTILFTTYTPPDAICATEGTSRLWSLYYKTGTEYFWPSLDHAGGTFTPFIELGPGQASWPTLHIGENQSLKAFTPLTSCEISDAQIDPAFPFKSGCIFWRKNTD